ncbi:MAG: sensor histidine kinase, partial [Acidimicrobiales bacterium]
LRRGLQDACDRRFRRRRHEATQVIAGYLDGLRNQQLERGALTRALAAALGDPSVEVGLWLASHDRYVDEDGVDVTLPPADGERVRSRVDRGREHLGVLVHRRAVLQTEPDVVDAVVAAAPSAFDHARLRAQVMVQLAEVRASRARILAAGDIERRRVERDLHDGAQQRLVALALKLQRLRLQAEQIGTTQLAIQIEQAATEVQVANAELRELARGLLPPILIEQGLAAAVTSLAERAPIPVVVEPGGERRYPARVETAAYFVVAEALVNVAKHAAASGARVEMTNRPGTLVVVVSDDGIGGAEIGAGSGLSGLRDRIDSLGGRFWAESAPGGGSRVVAELPT